MMTMNNLASFFKWRCQQQPGALAYAFVRDTLEIAESMTYAQLAVQVNALAGRIAQHSQQGDRVLLVYPPGLEFVRAFWACMVTGRIAVPVPAPDPVRFKNNAPRLRAIIVDAQASLVLTNKELLEPARSFRDDEGVGAAHWLATDGAPMDAALPAVPTPISLGPDSVAYLQYTSGSTSTPRGVIITHANVLAQCHAGATAIGVNSLHSRLLCWLPHFHDYGLAFGTLEPFHAGTPSYLMSPLTFLRRPLRWLDAIARYGITHTGAPNFAYVACVKALAQHPDWTADLASLVSSSCGAEPIHPDTPDHFHAAFASHGLHASTFAPAYGMAEAVLGVTATPPGAPVHVLELDGQMLARQSVREAEANSTQVRRIVGCGRPFAETYLRIVDAQTLEPCATDAIGEIWVQGSSVGQGYWRREQASAEIFGARTANGEGPYLRTGDLGFIQNGELFVTGRLKDLIIVHGRNHAPQDIEWTVQRSNPVLRPGYGAAFSINTDDGEALVVVQEVERSAADADLAQIARGIRRAVAEEHDLPIHALVLIRAGSVPRTTSGKIRRQSCKQEYLDGKLQALWVDVFKAHEPAAAGIEDFPLDLRSMPDPQQRLAIIERCLVHQVARFALRDPKDIPLDASPIECGLDSLSTFRLLQAIEPRLGFTLPPARVLGAPSLRAVAALIEALMAQPRSAQLELAALTQQQRQGAQPLSAAQRRMWFWQELAPGAALYNVPVALALNGPLDSELLEACLRALMHRHEILCSRWVSVDGRPMQRLGPPHDWRLGRVILTGRDAASASREYEQLAADEGLRPIDPTRDAPMRATLVTFAEQDHRLLWTLHHSICDGWSVDILLDELSQLYSTGSRGSPAALPAPGLNYIDYAHWEPQWLASGVRERELAYWTRTLAGVPTALDLRTDRQRPTVRRYRGASLPVALPPAQLNALRELAQRTGTTLFMTLLASWQTLMHRYSGQSSVVTGSVIANRERLDLSRVVGYFANTLALRSDFSETLTVSQLLDQVKARALDAIDHQHLPFEEVVEALKLPREPGRMPLVQTMIVLQAADEALASWGSVRVQRLALASPTAKFELTLELQEHRDALRGCIEYDTDLFEPATIERLARHWSTLLQSMCADPTQRVDRLPLFDRVQQEQLLALGSATPAPAFVPLQRAFELQARRTPRAVAALFQDRRLSYQELNEQANRLAHALRSLGVGRDVPVGICMDRSLELVVALWGVLKAGGAFVPMDAELPLERIKYQLRDTAAPVVLTQSHLLTQLPSAGTGALRHVLCLDADAEVLTQGETHDPAWQPSPSDLAYVIYTSGSTGQPKGVLLEHAGLSNHARWLCTQLAIVPADRLLGITSIGFDASLVELLHPLTHGACVVLAASGAQRDMEAIATLMRDHGVSVLQMVPSALRALLRTPALVPGRLRYVISGGEALETGLARELAERLPRAVIGNFYGPTEASIDSTHCEWPVPGRADSIVPIGRPITGMHCLVLDAHGEPVPIGAVGELCIGGVGVARGYLHGAELTAERFIAHPLVPSQRLYRSGDLARLGSDGRLEYLGRIDSQVKVRGYRIELGEVEAALNAQPGVAQAVVIADRDSSATHRLVAYVAGVAIDVQALKRELRIRLPEYMVPAAFVPLPRLPTLTNGKIDIKALPQPSATATQANTTAPRTPIERNIWEVWREVLNVEQFCVTDNFFELGGHSLLAMQLISRLRAQLRVELPLRTLFDAPTVEALARWFDTQEQIGIAASIPRAPAGNEAPLTAAQQGMWFAERLHGGGAQYNVWHAVRLLGALDASALESALQALAARHESLRSCIVESGGVATQLVHSAPCWLLQRFDLTTLPPANRDAVLHEQLADITEAAFALSVAPLARAALWRIGEHEHVFALTVHHIVCDGWSFDILLRELAEEYSVRHDNIASPLQPLALNWRDVAHWERARREAGAFNASLPYWRERLKGLEPLRLPLDSMAPERDNEPGPIERTRLGGALVERIENLARRHNATVFMVLLASVKTLLMRRLGRDDVAVGTPVAGRDRSELEPVVGLLLNTLVLRTDLGGNPSFGELLERVRGTTLDAWANQEVPLDHVVADLAPTRELHQQPFFDVMVNSFGAWNSAPALAGLVSEPLPIGAAQPKFALTVYMQATPGAMELCLVARRDRFSAQGLRGLLDQLLALLQQVTEQPTLPLGEYSLVTSTARALLPDPTLALAPPAFVSVLQRFTEQARLAPGRTAIRSGGRTHDYAELQRKVTGVAHALRRAGVQRGDVIAVCGPRSLAVVATMFAALQCGAVFMTLDPALPALRRRTVLRESGARLLCLIGGEHGVDGTDVEGEPIARIVFDASLDALALVAPGELHHATPCQPNDAAYVFLTSGSSGTPKAVLGRHSGLAHFIDWQRARFEVTPADRISQLIGLSFDPLLRDVFLPLTSGATLCIPQERDSLDPLAWLTREQVSIAHTTPTVMQSWMESSRTVRAWSALRWLFVAGEPLTDSLITAWRERIETPGRIVNLYGPTETTMARCFHIIGDRPDAGVQPVGAALPDSQALIVSPQGVLCGIGEAGEIAIRTPLRSLGYLGQPEENARRFRPNRWRKDPNDSLYFTGDRGRYRPDGALEILGRLDDQVKIRGVRIEPAEVMAVLSSHASIRQCAVLPGTGAAGESMLVAYVVAVNGAAQDTHAVRNHIAARLPSAYVPSAFVWLDALPILANGKVDRQGLPAPSAHSSDRQTALMPRSPIEQALWEIWRAVLRVETFGVTDSFFALGGHSLLATQVLARVGDSLGVDLPLRSLFETPTIAGLGATVEQSLNRAHAPAPALRPAIRRLSRDGLLPTSYSQRRMWLVQQFNPQTAAYNMPFAIRLKGALNRDVFVAAVQQLIARHEAFRTTLVAVDGEPMQRIQARLDAPMEFVDLQALPTDERVHAACAALRERSIVPYELSQGPLHRMTLVQLDVSDQVFFWSIHHSIGDGWSSTVLMRELTSLYPALLRGEAPAMPPKAIEFADYAAWQREALAGEVLEQQLGYWRQKLEGLEPLPLPADRPRRGTNDGRGTRLSAHVAPATLAGIRALAVEQGVTPYMALLACFQLLLARHCGVSDVAVGTPIANRTLMASEQLIGTLVNTVVMRTDLSGNPTFAELLQRVRETALQAYAHQDLPFEVLVEALAVPRSDASAPLVQVLFNVLNPPELARRMAGIEFELFEFDSGTSQFDLSLSVDTEMFGQARLSFANDLFDTTTGQRLLANYLKLLDQVVASPRSTIASFDLVGDAARATLRQWNDTASGQARSVDLAATLHGMIDRQAHRTPTLVALRSSTGLLKYEELQQRSNQLARVLRTRGLGRGALVGLCVERSLEMVVAQLAILKAGAAYVPLDPAYPQARLAHMCEDAQIALLITESEISTPHWPHHRSLLLDLDRAAIAAQSDASLAADERFDAGPRDPAYVIYTSGSTGKPKGVVVPHGAAVNFLASMAQEPGLQASDALVAVTTLSFDIAVLELLLPLTVGAQVILASREEAGDGKALRKLLETGPATVMQATPSTWRVLIEAGWHGSPAFKALIGGEALPVDLAQQLRARTGELWNMYGPTETTVWSTCWRVTNSEQGISIGRPIANTRIHVLDEQRHLCPIGVAGEIYIGGEGVALGYLNRPELTAERFVPDPFSESSGARLYRTGDRGRWREGGLLEHLGRLDHQVKVRGHRVELGEIEANLSKHPEVAQTVVIVREDRPGDLRLVAYVVARESMPNATSLREHLRAALPDYMLPQHFVGIDAVPLLPNGKMNRNALPLPTVAISSARAAEAPQTPLELAIAQVWQELLGVEQVGLRDNFFDLGGHSLLAVHAVAKIEDRLGIKLNARRLVFESLAQLTAGEEKPAEAPGKNPKRRARAKTDANDK